MFSRWDFARSAETIFSRWAIKRVCKFLLKKRLGDFILGDIDLDQLDVQLTQGTIHLRDLALNVDYLNQKLAGSAVMVKEGSIGSLSIKIPWKLQNCQIEVEELELVLAPFVAANGGSAGSHDKVEEPVEPALESVPESAGSFVSVDIHEGVKTIAKIVKWFLTSFHVRLRNLIVAFDPRSDVDEKSAFDFHRSLVLRITEIEYGTCVSEDPTIDSLLGKAKLTNFVKFHGAVVEFLKMEDVDTSLHHNSCLGTSFSEWNTGSSSLGSTVTVLTGASGASGGFSGRLNLSIPWKNGSLDIRKVDADFSVDPVKLCVQPSSIKGMIVIWESLNNVAAASRSHANLMAVDPPGSSMLGSDILKPIKENLSKSSYYSLMEETYPDDLLPRTHVIHNWVPLSINKEVETELEQDYGASIDQFFECFDGIRSSQGGSSGIWNWTCSVFSAITVASNLASGSGHIALEQQNVETSLRATIAEVSVSLLFHDEDPYISHNLMGKSNLVSNTYGTDHGSRSISNIISPSVKEQGSDPYMSCFSSLNFEQSTLNEMESIGLSIHLLEARCQNLLFNLQICPQKTNFQASVMHFKVDEYNGSRSQAEGAVFPGYNKNPGEGLPLDHNLQREVHSSLPMFPFPVQEQDSKISVDNNTQKCQYGLVKVVLLESFGICSCHCSVSSTYVDGQAMTSTSFSIELPPFVLWIHFQLINMLLNLFKNVETYFEHGNTTRELLPGVVKEQNDSSLPDGHKSDSSTYIATVSSKVSLQGNILLLQARVIFCFPSVCDENLRNTSSLDKFIVLELYPPGKGNGSDPFLFPAKSSPKGNNPCAAPSTSIHFGIGGFDIYLVDFARKNDVDNKCDAVGQELICAMKILSGINKTGDRPSGITIVWQKGPVTGPWMAGRAWSLASSHDQSRNKVAGNRSEFSSVTTGEDSQETSSHIRQELILSSVFFLQVHFSHVCINLDDHGYKLLNMIIDGISNGICSTLAASSDCGKSAQPSPKAGNVSQTSILLDCNTLEISIILKEDVEINRAIQKELEGSWNRAKLIVDKFEMLSVSNIGGMSDANFFWLNHGEGELWGSIMDRDDKEHDFLLIVCKNSTIRRGDGKGANALSFGSTGTTVLYLRNPQLNQCYTSIVVRCGTLVAPGGRMDWVNTIILFFSSSHTKEELGSDDAQIESSFDAEGTRGTFCLDLTDVALSYETPRNTPVLKGDLSHDCEIGEHHVACLLAAASLSFCNHNIAHCEPEAVNYCIQLKDLGLLVCEPFGSVDDKGIYYASHLKKTGYVKVAQVALVEAFLRIKGMFWEVHCSDSHVIMDTCQDTTNGLIRLAAQLQQLYAPDMEDAVAHLQSRWNTLQQTHKGNTSNEGTDDFSSSVTLSPKKKLSADSDDCMYVGLLDEILENAFNMKGDTKVSANYGIQSNSSLHVSVPCDHNTSKIGDATSLSVPFPESMHGSGARNAQNTTAPNTCMPQIIESYCLSEFHPPSKSTVCNLSTDTRQSKFDVSLRKNVEYGKCGWYQDNSLMILENHISKSDLPESASLTSEDKFGPVDSNTSDNCIEKGEIILKNIDVRWRMYAGLDWSKPREDCKQSSYIQCRDKTKCLELSLSGLNVQYSGYPDKETIVSKLSVCAQDFHLYDRSSDAPWRMVLGHYTSKDYPRTSYAKAFKFDLEAVRPDPSTPIEDYRLHLEILPLRLHLDQGQLDFLISFFGKKSFAEEYPSVHNDIGGSEMAGSGGTFRSQTVVEEALLPFFQKCEVTPIVVCVDYIPRHIDLAALRRGNFAELINLVPWKGIELQLTHVCAVGVYGWSNVCESVIGQWLEDISQNQVHKLVKGLAPVRSLFAVSSGTSKLISLPVKSYRKDQKFLKGMQRGAIAFLRSISLEAVGLGVHLAAGAHEMLLKTEYILTSAPPYVPVSERSRSRTTTVRSNQPEDAQQGIYQAYESISDGLGRTASALIGTPLKVYQRGAGAGSALATAVRATPAAAIAPVTASARAVHYTLLGVRNSLDPEHKRESMEKYLGPPRA